MASRKTAGKPVYMYDKGKGSAVYSSYDAISRPLKSYARDYATEGFTVRGYIVYGDDPTHGPLTPTDTNHLGQVYASYDESGLSIAAGYDFKGNPLSSLKLMVKDSLLLGAINDGASNSWNITPYRTDWTEAPWDEHLTILESGVLPYRTDTQYDALNRAVQVTLPEDINGDRKVLVPTYNRAGTAEKVTFDGTEYVKLMAYDAKGQLSLAAFDNELMTRYAYDPKTFRLKRTRTERYDYSLTGNTHEYDYLSGNVRQDLVYDYDLVGNILKQTNLAPDSGIDGTLDGADKLVRMFKYDPLYRLLQATGRESTNQSASYTWNEVNTISVGDNALNCRAYTQRYEYDKNGRILRMKHVANANNYTRKYNYATGNNRLDSIDNGQSVPTVLSAFTYDNNGNQTTANTERYYEYDAGDMMRAYYNQTSAGTEPTVYAHYVYSGGTRTKKLVRTASNEYESVIYLGPFEHHKKVTASTTEEKNYTNIIGGIEIRTGGFTGDITDTVVYSLGDHLGSVSTRVNSGRTIIDKEEYYPYGDSAMRTTDKKRYRYTGKEKDAESKLYYYGARYYTAWACTFTTVDPAAGSTHYQSSYNYADCNPIVMNDPTGMSSSKGGGNETKVEGAGGNGDCGNVCGAPTPTPEVCSPSNNNCGIPVVSPYVHNNKEMFPIDNPPPGSTVSQTKFLQEFTPAPPVYDPSYKRKNNAKDSYLRSAAFCYGGWTEENAAEFIQTLKEKEEEIPLTAGEQYRLFRSQLKGDASDWGTAMAFSYSLHPYDRSAIMQGKEELSNREKDELDDRNGEFTFGLFTGFEITSSARFLYSGYQITRTYGVANGLRYGYSTIMKQPVTLWVNPNRIRYMQSSIKNTTGGYTVLGNARALAQGTLSPKVLQFKIYADKSGVIWTLDHRRLAAFKLSGLQKVPVSLASPQEIAKNLFKMTTETNGITIKLKFGNGISRTIH